MPLIAIKRIIYAYCPSIFKPILVRIEASEIGSRLVKGIFWSMSGAVISRGLMLVASIVVARILGQTGYGELAMIQSTVGMFGVVSGFGLGLTATKHVAEFRRSDPARAGRIIGLSRLVAIVTGGVMALGLFIFAPWLAGQTINAPHLQGVLRIGSLILLINALNGAQTGALAGFEAFKTIAYVNVFVGLISFPILAGGAYFGGLTGTVWALAINLGVNWFLNYLALQKETRRYRISFSFTNCFSELSVLWKFSLPSVLSGAMVAPVNWICNAMLVNQPAGYGEMGIFNAANQWKIAILFIPGMVGKIALPMLSSLSGQNERSKYLKVLKYNVLINGGITLLLAIGVALFSHRIMQFYGPGFEKGMWLLVCLSLTAVLVAVNTVVGEAIASKGKMWVGFIFNALWASVILCAASILISRGYGALGLAYAILIAYIFHTIWQCFYISKILHKE